ncbi:hypothetical protein B7463_g7271, partial [Scytalidium lignicola]
MAMTNKLNNLQKIQSSVDPNQIITSLRKDGAVVLQNLVTSDQVRRFIEETHEPLSHVRENTVYSNEDLRIFHGHKTKRLSDLTSLGGAKIVEVEPDEQAQPLHRGQDEWPIFKLVGPRAPEACLNFLVAISDFTAQNGATRVIPGSHQ